MLQIDKGIVNGRRNWKADYHWRSRAASVTNRSAVTRLSLASWVFRTAAHQSAGILSLCRHLLAVGWGASMASANAETVGQSSMSSRKDAMLDRMTIYLGQFGGESKIAVDKEDE
jgi:hypothetical protein